MTDVVVQDNLILTTGGLPKPRDDKENPFLFALNGPPPKVANLNEDVFLPDQSHDPRMPMGYQMGIGSCAGWTAAECGGATHNEARYRAKQSMNAIHPHPGWIYEYARRKRGWFPQDVGSYLADCIDLLLEDSPQLLRHPYIDNAAYAYPPDLPASDNIKLDYVGSHQAFYPRQGNVEENIWNALKSGCAVMIGMGWPNPFFNPIRGRLPENVPMSPNDPGHAITIWGRKGGSGDLYCQNHWSTGWATDIPQTDFCRPGDFIIPGSYVRDLNGHIWEYRVVSPEKIEVPPEPEPQPTLLTIKGKSRISTASNIVVTPEKALTAEQKRQLKGALVTVTK